MTSAAASPYPAIRERGRRKLAGPPKPPVSILYLREYLRQLHGRSGIGMAGFARLSHLEIESWARLRGVTIQPHELDALLMLDDVMLAPPKPPTSPTSPSSTSKGDG